MSGTGAEPAVVEAARQSPEGGQQQRHEDSPRA